MEEKRPLVSVIVPVYNSAKYLSKLFASLLSQTYANLEIICVDDGSQDASYDILCQFALRDARIKTFRKRNSGAAGTRNFGINAATGDYICFVDSDDFIELDAIKLLVNIAQNSSADIVLFDLDNYSQDSGLFAANESINRNYVPIQKMFNAVDVPNIYKHIIGFTVNKFYRADFIRENKLFFPNVAAHEDMPFTYLALSLADGIYYFDKVLYHYRRANQHSVSNTLETDYKYMFKALQLTCEELVEHRIWEQFEKNFISYVLHMCNWQYARKNVLARIEFLETAKRVWFSKLGVSELLPQDVYDLEDYRIYEKALLIGKNQNRIAEFYRGCLRNPVLTKVVILFRIIRGKLARFIKSRQIFR
ncbi:glycosyltransferase family 2 protein [Arcanobacterium hippocoleae]|uniref:glycosyltransferase family 2 protein n=1 Tax=Arcanobacterium hippocoleae TaxID=149017 RepID=UPI00334240D2